MHGKSPKDVYHRSDTYESRRPAFRWIKRILGIPIAKFAATAADGKNYQVEYYGLNEIISVG